MAAEVARNGFNVTHDLGKRDTLLYFHFKPSNTIALPYVCAEAVLDSWSNLWTTQVVGSILVLLHQSTSQTLLLKTIDSAVPSAVW